MEHIKELPRIDRYSCKFENPILEKEFTFFRLNKISKFLSFSYFFFSFITLVDIYDLYFRIERFHPLMLINIFISLAMLTIGFSNKNFKIKHYSIIFITVFTIYGSYQAYLFGILLPQVAILNSSNAGDIIFMPFILIITLVVVPFNFMTAIIFSIWALVVNSPMLLSIPNINPIYLFFGIVAPFIILAFNKLSGV